MAATAARPGPPRAQELVLRLHRRRVRKRLGEAFRGLQQLQQLVVVYNCTCIALYLDPMAIPVRRVRSILRGPVGLI